MADDGMIIVFVNNHRLPQVYTYTHALYRRPNCSFVFTLGCHIMLSAAVAEKCGGEIMNREKTQKYNRGIPMARESSQSCTYIYTDIF